MAIIPPGEANALRAGRIVDDRLPSRRLLTQIISPS
jgi:hypothetical protein